MSQYILSIDQGTSSTKSLVFDAQGKALAKGSAPLFTHYLDHGFVEQDPEAIYQNVLDSVALCLKELEQKGFSKKDILSIGISNQRETFVMWDKNGKSLYSAIVWQCKRSVDICSRMKKADLGELISSKTGLLIDPYFSATKLMWLNENNPVIHEKINSGEAYFGTVDTWLLYKMTGGRSYATDHTNASRTMFFNLHTLQWDAELLSAFGLTGINLPEIKSSSGDFGQTTLGGLFDQPISITGMIGDSHAAAFGEACFHPGLAKATLGTGCSILMNIGDKPLLSRNGMVTTICWSTDDKVQYAYEGLIVSCGSTLEWLKNQLGLISETRETEAMAKAVESSGGVCFIPAFSGLGSPHWHMDRKASISGLGFDTKKEQVVRAALESIPFQIKDIIQAMEQDASVSLKKLNLDGGMTSNSFVMQSIADLLNIEIHSIDMPDVSAVGAAFMAGLKVGVYQNIEMLERLFTSSTIFHPVQNDSLSDAYNHWGITVQDA